LHVDGLAGFGERDFVAFADVGLEGPESAELGGPGVLDVLDDEVEDPLHKVAGSLGRKFELASERVCDGLLCASHGAAFEDRSDSLVR